MVNQIECHTKSAQRELVSYCQERSIAITAYSPISGAVSRTIIAGTWAGLPKIPAMVVRLTHVVPRRAVVADALRDSVALPRPHCQPRAVRPHVPNQPEEDPVPDPRRLVVLDIEVGGGCGSNRRLFFGR